MPRKSHKKQTRLAFAPAAVAPGSEDSDRFRTLAYDHPSKASVLPGGSIKCQETPKKKKRRSSKSAKLDKTPAQPEKETSSTEIDLRNATAEEKRQAQATTRDLGDTSSEDEIVIPSSQRRIRRTIPDEDTQSVPRRRLKRKAESPPVVPSDPDLSESEEPVVSSPVKRRRQAVDEKSPRTPRAVTDQDELDIEEDIRDLQDSVVKKNRTRGRIAESARDKRLKHLEILRRRRAGLKEESESETGLVSAQDTNDSDDTSSGHVTGLRDQDINSDVESEIASNEDLDRYDADFVLEDDSTMLGVPMEEIPFEFTRHAYKQPKEYFRDVIGWMVLNRLDPAFPRSDAMYEMAYMKLEDEVKGRAGSQLISSVWSDKFRRSLLARPHIEVTAFPTDANHPCDACNRSGHPASADMKLYGKPYSLETLEPINGDEDSSDEASDSEIEDNQKPDRDRSGHVLPDENTRFFLGRHCRDKAQLAHTLTHWRYHLNEWVVDYLERMGHMTDDEVLRRNNLSQKRKTRNALKVIEKMATAGEIDKLWRDFHINLKSAREQTSVLG